MSDAARLHPHPLERDGTSQRQRALAALDPSSAPIDERRIEDLLLYVRRYADLLRYTTPDNSPGGTWADLVEDDSSLLVATVADVDPERVQRAFERLVRDLRTPPPGMSREKAYGALLAHLANLVRAFDQWYRNAPNGLALRTTLERLIDALLASPARRLKVHAGRGKALGLLKKGLEPGELGKVWKLDEGPELAPLFPSGLPLAEGEVDEALDALARLFASIKEALVFLTSQARAQVAGTLSDHAGHAPHMTLLLAFLQLLGHARDHVNTLTGEHLQFYFRDVLGLGPKAAVPDRAHVLVGLAKGVARHRLAADTELKAGKDAGGVELVYGTDGELVVNRAALDPDHGLKTIFLAPPDGDGVVTVHAAPDADSADGLGAKIEDEEGKWPGFGSDRMPRAEIGFALASPMFFLSEGTRKIVLELELDGPTQATEQALRDDVSVWASGAKEWIELPVTDVVVAAETITWTLELGPEEDPVVAYDAEVLGGGFATSYPVVKLILDPARPPYAQLRGLAIETLKITVDVDGMRSLILENDAGVLDPAKPFLPFGAVPRAGSRFLIGSPEVFQKRLTTLDLTIEWADLPTASFPTHYAGYESPPAANGDLTATFSLLGNEWTATEPLFDDDDDGAPAASRTPSFTLQAPSRPGELVDFRRFGPSLRQGFLVVKLDKSFLHAQYPTLLAKAAIDRAPGDVPNVPYTPLMASLTLDYTAEETLDAPGGIFERLFRIGPFGHREADPVGARPLPTFTDEGTLLIGLAEVEPPQNLSLLLQVAEGSEDPGTEVPEVVWSYLADEEWADFGTTGVLADTTDGLLTSGVIRFALPEAMTASRTVLPAGLHWLRASIAEGTAAIPKLIAVHPQAVVASFRDRGNDPLHLADALPAGTIAKLRRRQAAVKSVAQPYASFGGRMQESRETFALRVSERLRHKGRAITPFDYERLVLENFPEVYKVRCVNHTRTVRADPPRSPEEDHEHAPGHVKVVAVPNLRNQNAVDPLKPRLSSHKLEAIRAFLAELATPFVKLEVANPDYEEIRVRFDVRFHAGFDKGFYTRQLREDIIGFLSPWLQDDAADLTFGGRIHRSAILQYVEKREYIDFVTDFQMDHEVGGMVTANVEEAVATRASAALVSAPDHVIRHGTTSCRDAVSEVPEGETSTAPMCDPALGRFLVNTRSLEIHDLWNLRVQCQVDEILAHRRLFFPTLEEARAEGYDYCAYCFSRELSRH